MLNKTQISELIRESKSRLEECGISKVGVFGSVVRGEQTGKSDIDILLDFKPGQETYENFLNSIAILEAAFSGYRIDVVTLNGLSPFIGPHIIQEVEYV